MWDADRLQPDLFAEVIEMSPGGERVLRFNQPIDSRLPELGVTPLPPYIHDPLTDPERYQTDLLAHAGFGGCADGRSALYAARDRSTSRTRHPMIYVTLHVGLDTFKPVETEEIEAHHIHTEYMEVTEDVANKFARPN